MSSRAEQFRQKAAECEQLVALVKEPQVKESFRRLANEWRDLARQVEELDT